MSTENTDVPGEDPLVTAAIECFARAGSAATLRTIAADAGVSAALLVKRFGSKDGLRRACDDAVLARIVQAKESSIAAASAHRSIVWGLTPGADGDQAVLLGYVMHAVLEGGSAGRAFLEEMIADARRYTGDAVAQGVVRPSRDEEARARYLVMSGVGALLLSVLTAEPDEHGGSDDLDAQLARARREVAGPLIELCTRPFFTDDAILRDFALQAAGRDPAAPRAQDDPAAPSAPREASAPEDPQEEP